MKTKRLKKLLMALGTPRNNAAQAIAVCREIYTKKDYSCANADIFRFIGAIYVDSHMLKDTAQSMYLGYLAGEVNAGEFAHCMAKLNNIVKYAKKGIRM